jgi:conjugal transfer pilus assembly protein TraA
MSIGRLENDKNFSCNLGKMAVMAGLLAVGSFVLATAPALAGGTDSTFQDFILMITGWLEGSLGNLVALIALMVAVVMCVVRFNVMIILGSLALAGLASFGPGLVSGMFSAVI